MKDITNEIRDNILNDNDELMARRKVKVMGEDTHIPFEVYREFIDHAEAFEINNLEDVEVNYKKFSEMNRVRMNMLKWVTGLAVKSSKHKPFRNNLVRLQKTYGEDYRRITGSKKISLMDKVRFKVVPKVSLYLTDMMINNFKHFENPLFTMDTFDINDRYGNRMNGARVTEHFADQMIYYEERELKTNEKFSDVKSGSERPFIMTCQALNADTPCLLVKFMQDGGKKIPLAPTIS